MSVTKDMFPENVASPETFAVPTTSSFAEGDQVPIPTPVPVTVRLFVGAPGLIRKGYALLLVTSKMHLGLWGEDHSRGPPQNDEFIYEPIDDGWFREIVDETTTIIGF
ncbi:MAG: hypothetical protein HOC09_18310 [Deltaproteobacteria bacterium]|nr:hypothetical protein [Deltaproteobacteria bacterium]